MKLKHLLGVFCILALAATTTVAQPTIKCLQGLEILTAKGETDLINCLGDELQGTVEFQPSSYATPIYFLVTDENNIIQLASLKPTLDLTELGEGSFRVYALSFVGSSFVEPGLDATTAELASVCYELSINYVSVRNIDPEGGMVATSEGEAALFTCTGDGNPDIISFATNSNDPFYTYIITDDNNIILGFADEEDSFDFEGADPGVCRVWGLSFVGDITAQPGDDLMNTTLASRCFDLSDNFVEVTRVIPDGGSVALNGGGTNATVCAGNEDPDLLSFTRQTSSLAPYAFVLTDENNNIIQILEEDNFDFNDSPAGVCRVWGLSYTGNITAQPGDNAASVLLTDDCADLSDNFIIVTKKDPEGGKVTLEDGSEQVRVCVNDGAPDPLSFVTSALENENYVFVITDESNFVLGLDEDGIIDFEGSPGGVCRVWGVAYTGNLTLEEGDNLAESPYSDECSERSTSFVTVTRIALEAGTVITADGATKVVACLGDSSPDLLQVQAEGVSSTGSYTFILTDDSNVILEISDDGSFDFGGADPGICRVWGLNYTGNLTAQPGNNAAGVSLSDECFDLSDSFFTVDRKFVDGGRVMLESDGETPIVCTNDGAEDNFTFVNTSTSSEAYIYVVTDMGSRILLFDEDGVINFEGVSEPKVRVWGISYTGNLTAEPGDNLGTAPLSDQCYERSFGFATLSLVSLDGGTITTVGGSTEETICLDDRSNTVLEFQAESSSTQGQAIFVVTDDNNVILSTDEDGVIDFAEAPAGICRVWNLNYTGSLIAQPGDNAAEVALSDECFDLSDNFVTISRKRVDGGSVTLEEIIDGSGSINVCVNDGTPDELMFQTENEGSEQYVFIITDANNNILNSNETGVINFEGVNPGTCFVWGVSYSGNLTFQPEDNITEVALSDECFDLSDNFVTVRRIHLDGGTLSYQDGSTEAVQCLGDFPFEFPIAVADQEINAEAYLFVITDENNTIVETSPDGSIDLDLDPGTYRIYGVNYSGNFTGNIGQNITQIALSDECFDLSNNFLTLISKRLDGGTVSLTDGSTEIRVCANDGVADELTFQTENEGSEQYIFIVTDEENNILNTSTSGIIDFEGAPSGVCRVWGLSYSGELTTQPGDNAAEAALSDECFDLSNNFITVTRLTVDGGTVSLPDGNTDTVVCQGDDSADVLTFESQGAGSMGSFTFVVTDDNNTILSISEDGVVDFGEASEGVCRVWGLNYTGNLIAQPGDNAAEVALSDECFDLSDNFVTVTRKLVDGGTVSLSDGSSSGTACVRDGEPDIFEFTSETSAGNSEYTFIVTDENNLILVILEGNSINFDVVPPGTCFVYGVSYTGELTTQINIDITTAMLADECFELSDNFITISKEQVIGGTVMLAEGGEKTFTCPSDDMADPVVVTTTGGGTGDYVFLITDTSDVVTGISEQPVIDFNGAEPGIYRVRGLAFSGNLFVAVGDDINEAPLSDECAQLSENFISVNHLTPLAGTVALDDGSTSSLNCPTSTTAPVLSFTSSGADSPGYTFLITDTSNIIQALPEGNSYDFSLLPNGIYRVWGLGFSGNLTAETGDDAAEAMLSDNCFALSDNFILIVNKEPQGGRVATEAGDTLVYTCPGDGNADVIRFDSTGAIGNYRYLITDENNVILSIIAVDSFDFEEAPTGICRVWGAGFTGKLTAEEGDNAAEVALSDDCYSLSENFIQVVRAVPEGGSISADTGELSFCAGDGRPDLVSFSVDPDSPTPYIFLITDENNVLQTAAFSSEIDFDTTGGGPARVWGLAYTGELSLPFGETVEGALLSDDCFDLSDNFIEVNRTAVDGGTISSNLGDGTIYNCRGDGLDDIVTFSNTSITPNAAYQYVLTNEDNRILRILETNQQNFENISLLRTRIWGISYTGDLLAQVGQTLTEAPISEGCYTLSDNFITSVQTQPVGGAISTSEGETELTLCIGQQAPLLLFEVSTSSPAAQVLLLTDASNSIIEVIDSLSVDFGALDNGDYRVWNLSYTGLLQAEPGQNAATAELASSCFELSDNSVAVRKGGPVDGGMINTIDGDTTFSGCPRNGVPDILIIRTSSTANTVSPYRYVVTDTSNQILIPDLGGSIVDFDGAEPGRYRVWGVSYTGNFIGSFEQDILSAMLSNECYEVSANFIDIFHEGPQGGQISTSDGNTGPIAPASCGGNASDEISFTDNGTATGAEAYAFLVTSNDSILAVISEGESFNFATLSCEQTYQVTGLAYTGELPELSGLFISDLLSGMVFDDCFDLSDNRIDINPDAGLQDRPENPQAITGSQGEKSLRELHLAPNPAQQWLQVRFKIAEPQRETSEILIINTGGEVMRRVTVPTGRGENQLQLNIETLPDGLFFLHVRHAQHLEYQRFIKVNN